MIRLSHSALGIAAAIWLLSCVAAYFIGLDNGRGSAMPVATDPTPTPENTSPTARSSSYDGDLGLPASWSETASTPSPASILRPGASTTRSSGAKRVEPTQALLRAMAVADPETQSTLLESAAARMTVDDVFSSLESLVKTPAGPQRGKAMAAVLYRWGQLDPLAALTYAAEEPEPALRRNLKGEVLEAWGSANPSEALAYVQENPDGLVEKTGLTKLFQGVGRAPPEIALAFLSTADAGKYGTHMRAAISRLYALYPQDVVNWSAELPEGPLRNLALSRTVEQWARYDPETAKAWLEKEADPQNRLAGRIELGESWAQVDPQAAVDWFQDLPQDEQNPHIMRRIFGKWMQFEPENAATWLSRQTPSPELDSSIQQYIKYVTPADHQIAMDWTASLSNPAIRQREMRTIADSWVRRDPAAALDFLETSDIPGRKSLIASAQKRMGKKQ